MAITSLASYLAAPKANIIMNKASGGISQGTLNSTWIVGGTPGAGARPGDTTNGVVPTASTTGAPSIPTLAGNLYITNVEFTQFDSVGGLPGRVLLLDRLYHAGSFNVAAATTYSLSSQPSFTSRIPSGEEGNTFIFFEIAGTSSSGSATMYVTYTDGAGGTGRQSESVTINMAAFTGVGCIRVPLEAGRSGVQQIESFVVSSSTTSGGSPAIDVVVARPLGYLYVVQAGSTTSYQRWLDRWGPKRIYNDSCLYMIQSFSSGNAGVPGELNIEIAAG